MLVSANTILNADNWKGLNPENEVTVKQLIKLLSETNEYNSLINSLSTNPDKIGYAYVNYKLKVEKRWISVNKELIDHIKEQI